MKRIKVDTSLGNTITTAAEKAKEISKANDCEAYFDFNGIECRVQKDTVIDWLVRDYMNAHIMDWKTVGADCEMSYDHDTEIELCTRKLNRAKANKESAEKQRMEDEKEKTEFEKKVIGIEMEISDVEGWNECKEKNKDPYGKCCVEYAESWARLMQKEISNGSTVSDCAERTSYELGFYGITGFMYGAAVYMLSKCWKHGEELRKWHNKEYKHEGEGVVNPAVLTIG